MSVVLDASVFVQLLVANAGSAAIRRILPNDRDLLAPEHFTIEVANALRGSWRGRALSDAAFTEGLRRLREADIELRSVRPLLPRIGQLAHSATAYDAAYVALAETLHIPLFTLDQRLRRVPGARCDFLP